MTTSALLVLQVVFGAALFLGHGFGKIKDTSGTIAWFKQQGYGALGGIFAIIAEGIASVLLVLGIFPRTMAAIIAVMMLGAMTHHWKNRDSFEGGWETPFLFFVAAVVIIIGGVSPWGLVL